MRADLPNLLSLLRLLLAAPMLWLATRPGWVAAGLFVAAGVTDWADGVLARRLARTTGRSSAFGRMLDPIADKLVVAAALLGLAAVGGLEGSGLYAAGVILGRELLVSGLREFVAGRATLPVTWLAKAKTAAQFVAVGSLLAWPGTPVGEALLWVAAVLSAWTAAGYVRATLHLLTPLDPPP